MQAAKPVKWAILGAGKIAAKFAGALHEVESAIPFAVGSRDLNKAAKFAAELGFERPFGSYQAVLECPEVDAVYIATPHPFHAEWTVRAARAGKHILCEKPMAMNVGEARSMFAAARQHGVFLMEAFMYRCHPQTGELVRLVAGDRIGDIRIIESSFNFHANFNPEGRLFAMRLGGGAILDVGCYAVSMPRLLFGASRGEAFANAAQVGGYAHFGPSGCDEYAVGSLQFSEGRLAQVSAGIRLGRDNALRVYGTDGYLVVPFPWWCREGVRVYDSGATSPRVYTAKTKYSHIYAYEVEVLHRSIDEGHLSAPEMSWEDTLGNIEALDSWRSAVGLRYPSDGA